MGRWRYRSNPVFIYMIKEQDILQDNLTQNKGTGSQSTQENADERHLK